VKNLFLVALAASILSIGGSSSYAQIERNIDEFTGKITLSTPSLKSMSLTKVIRKNDTSIYLRLKTCGSTLNVNETGAIVLFMDGTKLTFNEKVDVDAGDGDYCDYEYSAFCVLKPSDLTLLCSKRIKAFRLYIYDCEVDVGECKVFLDNANLILDAH
jgi:hypothetical protein